ncbi:hypothetical protein N9751_01490 [Alphaproteobacteria bacterium]|jgi:hypothetical protein|nr:hypothetical protein [Alphaproteobacteria bacterium]
MIEHTEKEMKKIKANMLILYMYFSQRNETLELDNEDISEIDFFLMWQQGESSYKGLKWNELGELQGDEIMPDFYKDKYPLMISSLIEDLSKEKD